MRSNKIHTGLMLCCLALFSACHINPPGNGDGPKKNNKKRSTDYLEIAPNYDQKAPANLAILPVHAEKSVNEVNQEALRNLFYDKLMKKDYVSLSIAFTDKVLKDLGIHHTPCVMNKDWNRDAYKNVFTEYCDGVAIFSIEHYKESGQPGRYGIEIWGKAAIFDSKNMNLLFERYLRQTLYPTDPGGGRDKYIKKALEEFAALLLKKLPKKKKA